MQSKMMMAKFVALTLLASSFAACSTVPTQSTAENQVASKKRNPAQAACSMLLPYYHWESEGQPGEMVREKILKDLGYTLRNPSLESKQVGTPGSYVLDLRDGESGLLITAGQSIRIGHASVMMVVRNGTKYELASVQVDAKSGADRTLNRMFEALPPCKP